MKVQLEVTKVGGNESGVRGLEAYIYQGPKGSDLNHPTYMRQVQQHLNETHPGCEVKLFEDSDPSRLLVKVYF